MASRRSTANPAPDSRVSWRAVTGRSSRAALPALLLRGEDRPATGGRAALAHVQTLGVLILGAVTLVRVVVRQLFAGRDVANGLDVDMLSLVDRLAIRRAAVVDEARFVAADGGIDHGVAVDAEQEGVVTAHAAVVVSAVGLVMRDALARILDDARAALDRPEREGAAPLNFRAPKCEVLVSLGR